MKMKQHVRGGADGYDEPSHGINQLLSSLGDAALSNESNVQLHTVYVKCQKEKKHKYSSSYYN